MLNAAVYLDTLKAPPGNQLEKLTVKMIKKDMWERIDGFTIPLIEHKTALDSLSNSINDQTSQFSADVNALIDKA